ncbi:ATP-binding protein [uncultured Flavobacterium sp.]|uniref:ATP-binding protein n=1 Tax=uncultured Flavobacterium sp. TaxID=165435 RepID=UPI00122B87C2|nr:ATP-binding protein [uncultured Flavobacterium sp.]THD31223.1 MAG: response regulator [Flavobacterium johnsoniae]
MKHLPLFFILLFSTLLPAQHDKLMPEKIDSVDYYIQLANFNLKINNYQNALESSQNAIEVSQKKGNKEQEANAYTFLGSIYFELKKYDDAIETYVRSISLYNDLEPSTEQAYCYYNLGLCYMEKGKYGVAEIYFDKANVIYETIDIPDAKELLNLQKGILYKAKDKTQLAATIFNSIIAKPDNNDSFKTKAEALYQMGAIEFEAGRNNLALNYLRRALDLNAKSDNFEQKSKILKLISETYEKMMDIDNSFIYLKKHLALKDSILRLNSQKIGAEAFEKFKESEQMKTIKQKDKENREQKKLIKVSKLTSVLSIALITILSLLSLSLYKNNIIRNRTNKQLQEKNTELEIAKDKAEKASQARAEFLSTVSHELRTPLNAINGITHLLIEENPKKSQIEYLKSLKFSGNYLLTFINEILEINRIESNNIEIENICFNLRQLLTDIQNSLKEIASQNNIDFGLEIDPEINTSFSGDPTKLSQIFMNLINNALKFTENGTVIVRAKLLGETETRQNIYFEIVDTGIGIPAEKQEVIFESFSQGSVEINRKYGGTGLGLAIVKRLVSLLGGTIKLESTISKGSNFNFSLELEKGIENKESLKLFTNDSDFVDKKVLLVEDNKINQMVTRKMLEKKQIQCEIVDNGEDAIEAVRENKYDLVLMDVHLPGINGTIATQSIRKFDKKTPIIALTAISLNENREMLLSFGMTDVITKPFNPDVFYRVIAESMS